jgi:hypothetical protein
MSDKATLASLGRARSYCEQVNAGTGVLLAVILANGVEADSTLVTRLTLADVLAVSANKEAAWTGGTTYARKSYSSVTITPSNSPTQVSLAITNPTWSTAGTSGGGATPYKLAKLGVCYAPTAGSANSAIVPLVWLDWPAILDGSNLTYAFDASGFWRDSVS